MRLVVKTQQAPVGRVLTLRLDYEAEFLDAKQTWNGEYELWYVAEDDTADVYEHTITLVQAGEWVPPEAGEYRTRCDRYLLFESIRRLG